MTVVLTPQAAAPPVEPAPGCSAGSTRARLDRDWIRICEQPWAAEALAELPVPAGVRPRQLPAEIGQDAVLARACVLAAQGRGGLAELASQALLQALLPMLARMAGRDSHADLDDYLAEAWIRIRTVRVGPATTVPTGVGLDALHAVCVPRRRLQRWEVPQRIPDIPAGEAPAPEGRRALEVISAAMALGIVARSQLSVLASVYVLEMSSADAGELHRMSAEAVRARCSRAVRSMRRHADELRDYLGCLD